jgi:putative oxidoreductase
MPTIAGHPVPGDPSASVGPGLQPDERCVCWFFGQDPRRWTLSVGRQLSSASHPQAGDWQYVCSDMCVLRSTHMNWIFNASPSARRMLAVLRIVAGLLFVSYGTMKLFGYPPSPTPLPPFSLLSQIGIAGILEVFGGLAIVLGLLTRPVAFVLAGEMAVAYFHAHFPQSPFPTVNNGVPAVLYCFLFLYLSVAGAGAWSVDSLIARRGNRRLQVDAESHPHVAPPRRVA